MLDKNTLSQLTQLKANIHASREFAEGVVASTNGRFGFVRLEDGRDAYLSPEKMQKVLPGDRVKVELIQNKDGKLEANLEKLLSSELKRFVANYRIKGQAHFVEPVDSQINRWIFVPPKFRNSAKQDELLVAKVTQHPWKDSKAQAKVLELIGKPDQAYFDFKFVCAQYALNLPKPRKLEAESQNLTKKISEQNFGERNNLEDIEFLTIDAASTRDMDDAISIKPTDSGYTLYIAIADPSSFIDSQSLIASTAEQKAQTLYLNGGVISMLPEVLANDCFSLTEGQTKPALVCCIELDKQAAVLKYEFSFAQIRSHHKLNYEEVHCWLSEAPDDRDSAPEPLLNLLKVLKGFADLRFKYRKQHNRVNEDQLDYHFLLDENGKIADITKREKLRSHRLVEECMLLTNTCAGEFLANHGCGIFTVNQGFRKDRIGEAKALLKEEKIETEGIENLETYCKLLRELAEDKEKAKLIPALRRMSENSGLRNQALPHMGIGFQYYSTVTSPIRRFADLYNHWKIREILNENISPNIDDTRISALNENIQTGRKADRELKQILTIDYAMRHPDLSGPATIRIVTPQGFGARFVDSGIDGFVLIDKSTEKSFDAKRLTMKVGDDLYFIGKSVNVKLNACDPQKKRVAFELA